jgi:hypothetical protein
VLTDILAPGTPCTARVSFQYFFGIFAVTLAKFNKGYGNFTFILIIALVLIGRVAYALGNV